MSKLFQVAFEINAKLANSFGGVFTSATGRLAKLQQQAHDISKQNKSIESFKKMQDEVAKTQAKWVAASVHAKKLATAIASVETPTKKMENAADRARNSADNLQKKLANQRQELVNLRTALHDDKSLSSDLAQAQQHLQQVLGKTTQQIAQQQKSLALQSKMQGQYSKMKSAWGGAAIAGAGVGYALGAPIKQAAEAEYQQQLIANTVGLTKQQQIELNQKVAEYSKLTNQTQGDLTQGVGFLTAAGMDYSTAINMLGTMGKTATATGSNIEDVAKTLYAVNSNLKITASEGAAAMDAVLIASKEGNVEFKDMAAYLPTVTAGAASLGITGQKGLAALAAGAEVARIGAGSAEEAFNNQKNFLQKITSKEFVTNAAKMGINMKDQIQKGLASGDLLGYLTKYFKDLTKGDKFKTSALFTDMQAQGYINAQMQNYDKYIAIRDKALNGGGEVDKDAGKMMNTTQEQMKALQIRMQETALELGKSLIPAFQVLMKTIQPYIESVSKFIQNHPKVTAGIAGVAIGVVALKAAMASWQTIQLGVTAAQWAFNTALTANPIGIVVMGIAALAGGMYWFYTQTEIGRKCWTNMVSSMSNGIEWAITQFKKLIDWVSSGFEAVAKLYDGVKSFLGLGGNTTVTANMQHLIPQQNANGLGNKLASANQQLAKQSQNNSKTNNNTQHITYSPSIVIQGNADKSQVQQAMTAEQSNFDEMMRNKYRLSY